MKPEPMDSAAYAAYLGGAFAAQQELLLALISAQPHVLSVKGIEAIKARSRQELAKRDVKLDHTSDTHWQGRQETFDALLKALRQRPEFQGG